MSNESNHHSSLEVFDVLLGICVPMIPSFMLLILFIVPSKYAFIFLFLSGALY